MHLLLRKRTPPRSVLYGRGTRPVTRPPYGRVPCYIIFPRSNWPKDDKIRGFDFEHTDILAYI